MIKLHLAQIHYIPAYHDAPVDYLEEPAVLLPEDHPLGSLRESPRVANFLSEAKAQYIDHITRKLAAIAQWSAGRNAAVLVFPEYSVPVSSLPDLCALSRQHGLVIIAGSHRIPPGREARAVYEEVGLVPEEMPVGAACVPVISPDELVKCSFKLTRSKWEPNLMLPDVEPKPVTVTANGRDLVLGVLPCIDSLHAELLGKLITGPTPPDLIVCPSLSPTTEPFWHTAALSALREVPFAYVNGAAHGDTFYFIPDEWDQYLQGTGATRRAVPENVEAVLEVEIEPGSFAMRRGSIESGIGCTRPRSVPVVYEIETQWLAGMQQLDQDVCDLLSAGDVDGATEWLDDYLSEAAPGLPDAVMQNLKTLRHSVLPLFGGDLASVHDLTEVLHVAEPIQNTVALYAGRIWRALGVLTDRLRTCGAEEAERVSPCLLALKRKQKHFPAPPEEEPSLREDHEHPTPAPTAVVGLEDDLVEAFQDRGPEMDRMKEHLANPTTRLLAVTGALGIGKTDFVNCVFRKSLRDWQTIRVQTVAGASFARVLTQVAYRVGLPLDRDSLSVATHKVVRQKTRKVLERFFSVPRRALIIDDLHDVLKGGHPRDHRLAALFIEEAASPPTFLGGRVLVVSSQFLPGKWLRTPGVAHLHLGRIRDIYARRVVEYHMRRSGLIHGEDTPSLPQDLLDLVGGHPLSALLVVEALRANDMEELGRELRVAGLTRHVARELLSRVSLTADDEHVMEAASVFRLRIRLDVLMRLELATEEQLGRVVRGCLVSYDGGSIHMHEAIRRFYYGRLTPSRARQLHAIAASHYREVYERRQREGRCDPGAVAELVHHLTLGGEVARATDVRLQVVDEITRAARIIYKEHRDYHLALRVYRWLADIAPDSPRVLAYVARCHGRLRQWEDSDTWFEKAIKVATNTKRPTAWIYRDWGHIRARYGFYEEAERHLSTAARDVPSDPAIIAARAYIRWQQGEPEDAQDLFEQALRVAPHHEYTLAYYPQLLDDLGRNDYAQELRDRLEALDWGADYGDSAPLVEYEGDLDDYDIGVEYDDDI